MLVKGNTLSLDRIKRILLIQLGDIGDVVLTIPTIKALKENYPSAEIFVLLRNYALELIEGCPWVDGVISVKKDKGKLRDEICYQKDLLLGLRRKGFELAIDLRAGTRGAIVSFLSGASFRVGRYRGDGRLWRNRLFTHLIEPENESCEYSALHNLNILAPLELRIEDTSPELTVTKEKERIAADILRRQKVPLERPIIAIHPFSRWGYKEWPIGNYIELINDIGSRYGVSIVITGPDDERDRAAEIVKGSKIDVYSLAGKTSIAELVAVLKRCSLLIGIDSAAVHIAAAVGIPTVTIFGPSSPVNWAPRGKQHCVIYKDLPCVPCRKKGCDNSEVSQCLDELSVEEVAPVIDKRLLKMDSVIK